MTDLYTPRQVADMLGMKNERTVRRWLRAGKLPGAFRINGTGRWRIPVEALVTIKGGTNMKKKYAPITLRLYVRPVPPRCGCSVTEVRRLSRTEAAELDRKLFDQVRETIRRVSAGSDGLAAITRPLSDAMGDVLHSFADQHGLIAAAVVHKFGFEVLPAEEG